MAISKLGTINWLGAIVSKINLKYFHDKIDEIINRVNSIENTITGSGATVTLTAAQSGSTIMLDRAAGISVTLPTAAKDLKYKFIVTTAASSGNYVITARTSADLYKGSYFAKKASTADAIFAPNGSSNYIFTMNGTDQGGLVGSVITVTSTGANAWVVEGYTYGSGSLATSFSG